MTGNESRKKLSVVDENSRADELMAAGEYAQAAKIFEVLFKAEPQNLSVRRNLALCYYFVGRLEEFEDFSRSLLNDTTGCFLVVDALAKFYLDKGRIEDAAGVLAREIVSADCPDYIYRGYLGLLLEYGLLGCDHMILHKWMSRKSSPSELRLGYAQLLANRGNFHALHDFLIQLERDATDLALEQSLLVNVYSMLVGVVMEVGSVDDALHYLGLLESVGADKAHILLLQAQYFRYKGLAHLAIDALRGSLALDMGNAKALSLLGNMLLECGEVAESLKMHYEALRLAPKNSEHQVSAAMTMMAASDDLRAAWQLYEGRWGCSDGGRKSQLPWPEWDGVQTGGRLLLYREQGLGDEIFWASMLEELCSKFDKIVYICHPKLLTIFARSFPSIVFVPDTAVSHPLVFETFDYQMPVGSLAKHLRPARDDFSRNRSSILVVDEIRARHWRQRFESLGEEITVGLAWRSGNVAGDRARYYPSIASLEGLLSLPGVRFINLQYQITQEESAEVKRLSNGRFHDFSEVDHFNDLDASVAMMKACDIVVSPSTSTAALAAAIGVPVLDLMAIAVEGVHLGEQHSPWLPMMTLFGKQPEAPWEDSVCQVASVVAQLVKDRGLV